MATPSQTQTATAAQRLLKSVTKLQGHPDQMTQRMHTAAADTINSVTAALNNVMDFSTRTVARVTKPLQAVRLLLSGSGPSPTFGTATTALGPNASAAAVANAAAVPLQLSTPSNTSGAVYTAWNKGSLLGLMVGYDIAVGGAVIRQVTSDPLYIYTANTTLNATFSGANVTFAGAVTGTDVLGTTSVTAGNATRVADVNVPLQGGRGTNASPGYAYIGCNRGSSYALLVGWDPTGNSGGGAGSYIRARDGNPLYICIVGTDTIMAKLTSVAAGWTLTSPVQTTSGYLMPVGPFALANMVTAAAVNAMTYGDYGTTTFSGTTYGFVPTRAGSVIGISGRVSSTVAATHTLAVYANGTFIASVASATIAANTPTTVSVAFAVGTYAFTSGQVLEIRYTCGATGTAQATATMMLSFAG